MGTPVSSELPPGLAEVLARDAKMRASGIDDQGGLHEQAVRRDHAEALAGGFVSELTVGDRRFYNLTELTPADRLRLQAVGRERLKGKMRAALPTAMLELKELRQASAEAGEMLFDEADAKLVLAVALACNATEDRKPEPTLEQLAAWGGSLDGLREIVLIILKGQNPTVTRGWVTQSVTEDNYDSVSEAIRPLVGVGKVLPKATGGDA